MKKGLLFLLILSLGLTLGSNAQNIKYSELKAGVQMKKDSTSTITITDIPDRKTADKVMIKYGNNNIPPKKSEDGKEKQYTIPKEVTVITIYNGKDQPFIVNLTKSTDNGGNTTSAGKEISYTGIAFNDASLIYTELKKGGSVDGELVTNMRKRYANKDQLSANPFFSSLRQNRANFQKVTNELYIRPSDIAGFQSATGKAIPDLSGMDVTKFVQGFSDFLRDRIKAELTLAFIDKLKKTIEATEELKYLLPKTREVFNSGDPFNLPTMGPAYKAAFAEDLQNLMPDFEAMVYALPKYKDLRDDDGFQLFMISYRFTDYSAKGYHPIEILRLLDCKYGYPKTGGDGKPVNFALSAINMFSQNLKVFADITKWVSKNNLRLIDKDFIIIFFGLLYDKYPQLLDSTQNKSANVSFLYHQVSGLITNNPENALDRIYNLLIIGNNIDRRIEEFKIMRNSAVSFADKRQQSIAFYLSNVDDIINLIDFSMAISDSARVTNVRWKKLLQESVEVAKGINTDDLGKVTVNSISLIRTLTMPAPLKSGDQKNDTLFRKYRQDSIAKIELLAKLSFYTNFITDIASADSAAQIKAVLNKYAAPVGSYRVSRESASSFTLAAYPGFYAGIERSRGIKNGRFSDKSFGVTAPVGFAFNFGTRHQEIWSVFLSMVDIGAALSYRWSNDTTDIPDKITLGQIFSPGVNLIYGIKGSPLALKLGYQYAPQLRKIGKEIDPAMPTVGVWRLSFGITVDVPVFIFSKTGKPKSPQPSRKRS